MINDSAISDPTSVTLCEDIEIPAKHEIIQTACIKGPFIDESILEPNSKLVEKGILIARVLVRPKQQIIPIQIINPGVDKVKLYKGTNLGSLEHVDIRDPVLQEMSDENANELPFHFDHLEQKERKQLENLLQNYENVFASDLKELGSTSLVEHRIETGDAQPIKQLPRRLPNTLKPVVEGQVKEMLENEIIRPSQSPWASPIVLVQKKDGTWRFCVDYRKLNDVTIKVAFPIPQINDLIDTLSGQQYFTTLDMISGYWQVKVDENSKEKTAFTIPGGQHLEFNRLAFGLANAVPTFQRLMQRVLEGLTPKKCLVYLDDILVTGRDFEEHLRNLEEVLQAIQEAGLKLKPSKCVFAQTSLKYLGFIVSNKGLAPDPEKVKAVAEYEQPENLTELRRFMGLVSYYRRFVSGFSDIASPLHKLMQKDVRFIWNTECDDAFKTLKEQLITCPILSFPDNKGEFMLYTDASDVGVGAILTQKLANGEEKVISYASKAFSRAEKNWTTTEKEAYAIVWSLEYFHAYVHGRPVTVYTDHKALQWLRNIKQPNGKLARWILKLEQYDYTVVHKPGTMMSHVDALSRAPVQGIKVSTWSTEEFQELQDLDEDISIVKNWIHAGKRPDDRPKDCTDTLSAL